MMADAERMKKLKKAKLKKVKGPQEAVYIKSHNTKELREVYLHMRDGEIIGSIPPNPGADGIYEGFKFVRSDFVAIIQRFACGPKQKIPCWLLEYEGLALKAKEDEIGLELVPKPDLETMKDGPLWAPFLFEAFNNKYDIERYNLESMLLKRCFLSYQQDTSMLVLKDCFPKNPRDRLIDRIMEYPVSTDLRFEKVDEPANICQRGAHCFRGVMATCSVIWKYMKRISKMF